MAALALLSACGGGSTENSSNGDNDSAEQDGESSTCADQAVSCDGTWARSCQSGVWVRVTDCSKAGQTCAEGKCTSSSVDGDPDSQEADSEAASQDGDLDSESAEADSAETQDQDSDSASETPDGDSDSVSETPDGDSDSVSETPDGDSDSTSEAECTTGDCCSDGQWVQAGAECVTGKDAFTCTQDTCDAAHTCQHTLVGSACLINSTCYTLNESLSSAPCSMCDPSVSTTSWSPAPTTTTCDDSTNCTFGDHCDGHGACTGSTVTCPADATDICGARYSCNGTETCTAAYAPATTACETDNNVCTQDVCSGDGTCQHNAVADGTSCDDGNANTINDKCVSGVCTGTDLCKDVVCSPLDSCHVAGTCNPQTGVCSNPNSLNGAECDDGNANTIDDQCTDGVCKGTDRCAGVTCTALDQCHQAGTCDSATGHCSNPQKPNSTVCDDGNANTVDDVCTGGICAGVDHCVGVTCEALDVCHIAGTCDHSTGICSNPIGNEGGACDDGNANTVSDACASGTCTGIDLCKNVTCGGPDQCHEAGSCDPLSGLCTFPPKADSTVCDDGNANTVDDVCTGGICAGVDHCVGVTCTALDACHTAGTCDHSTGACSNPTGNEGGACDDGNSETQNDTCSAGSCIGHQSCVIEGCPAADQCHEAGVCDALTGLCSYDSKVNGTPCDDGNSDTVTDTCESGTCLGTDLCAGVMCTAIDTCHSAGTCDHATGSCSTPAVDDATPCDDGNNATIDDVCVGGICLGTDLCKDVACMAVDQCHDVGTCDAATGMCSNPTGNEGGACDDGNPDTTGDVCTSGVCGGTDLCAGVTCTALDVCHVAGTCNAATGICSNPAGNEGGTCDDGNANTTGDVCTSGVCAGVDHCAGVTCTALDACHVAGTCDHATGTCSNPSGNDGGVCDDGNAATFNDVCASGSCAGYPAPTVASTTPADSATPYAATSISITFSEAMSAATLTVQTTAGACTGSIQVSTESDFSYCIGFAAATATMSTDNKTATFTPAPGLLVNRSYKIRVTTAVSSAHAVALQSQFTQATAFTTLAPSSCHGSVVISQIFGNGGGSATQPNADYVVLHNRSEATVDLTGWSLQYAAATSSSSTVGTSQIVLLSGSISAGGYDLVKLGTSSSTTGTALPTADLTATGLNISGTKGKLFISKTATALTTDANGCPTANSNIVDFVGYGATNCTANTAGTTTAPTTTDNTKAALFRAGTACTDDNVGSTDFAVGTPAPVNSTAAANSCTCSAIVAVNELGSSDEINFCVTHWPYSTSVTAGATSETIYGRVWQNGITPSSGTHPIIAQVGVGSPLKNPQYEDGWTWTTATFNVNVGNNDEYMGTFVAPTVAGTYAYVYRMSLDGSHWTYCDLYDDTNTQTGGAGSNGGLQFDFAKEAPVTVTAK